ncbi:MAG: hypothetical protein C5B48_13585 [Candidatus Rokuibacteriota bacterium]|nr:MAG: hypothetical protein C5B48_13585 [Candidatus Rokubacteria bacterium]
MRIHWSARPASSSGRSNSNAAPPAASSSARTASPRYAATARPRWTATPPRIAGSASTGSACLVASCNPVAAVSAAVARPASVPALRSIDTPTAVAVAAPPGRIRPAALPLSCAAATGNQALVPSAIRSSSQRQAMLAASAASAAAANAQSRCVSDRHEPKTASRLGSRK